MANQVSKAIAQRIDSSDLLDYLRLSGWKERISSSGKWLVFEGYVDDNGRPLEIVLPKESTVFDYLNYISAVLELLFALNKDTSIETTVARIRYFKSDVLSVRNVDGFYDSIPLELASKQIHGLTTLIRDAADMEHEPIPYFQKQPSSLAKSLSRRVRFGHTFRGSFGFTLESPINQLPLFDDPKNVVIPLERRVMERIVRGLGITRQAVDQSSIDTLVYGYASGFNANMCNSILEMSDDETISLEYKILWSPAFRPSDDVRTVDPVHLDENDYQYLARAGDRLKEMVVHETVTVRGRVIDIRTTDNPLGEEAQREIIIRWANREDGGRPVGITVEINAEEYVLANQAQLKWSSVLVEGEARFTGSKWVLDNPRHLRIAGDQQQSRLDID